MYYHRVWADIDLEAVTHNLEQIKTCLPRETAVMVVVKADAYGHSAVKIAKHLEKQSIWGFGVGDSNEALELREAGITLPILILGAIIEDEIGKVVKNGISTCIHSWQRAVILDREARQQRTRCSVHLMVDTGMGRLGIFPEHSVELARKILSCEGLSLEGVLTHYSCSTEPEHPFNEEQRQRFMKVRDALLSAGIHPPLFHAANSAALLAGTPEPFNLVRAGLAIYGIQANPRIRETVDLQPVLSLRTQIIYMKDVPAGTPIGYNRRAITDRPTRIATLPIGYNDGYPYRLGGKAQGLVNAQVAPVVGAISMDYIMIDVGQIEGASVGDWVTLIGRDGDHCIRVEDLAEMADTIPYEIICRIGKRVPRVAVTGKSGTGKSGTGKGGIGPPSDPPENGAAAAETETKKKGGSWVKES